MADDNDDSVIVVFDCASKESILEHGGSRWWKINVVRARSCPYLVCVHNGGHEDSEGSEEHNAAFLVAKVTSVQITPDNEERCVIRFDEYADIHIPDVWQGWRFPVRYMTLEELGIDPTKLIWKKLDPRPEPEADEPPKPTTSPTAAKLSIAEAKRGLCAM
ncbi:MAG: hypothetical protein U1E53_03970 [Dongiaceae bacterium]